MRILRNQPEEIYEEQNKNPQFYSNNICQRITREMFGYSCFMDRWKEKNCNGNDGYLPVSYVIINVNLRKTRIEHVRCQLARLA